MQACITWHGPWHPYINKRPEFIFIYNAVIIPGDIYTNLNVKFNMYLDEADPETWLHLNLSKVVRWAFWTLFLGKGGQKCPIFLTPFPTLTSIWEKLESWNFVIIYTIMYAFAMHKKIFECFLMPLLNLDSTTGCSHEIQNFVSF